MRQWFGAVSKNPRELQERAILINYDKLTSPAKNLTWPGKEVGLPNSGGGLQNWFLKDPPQCQPIYEGKNRGSKPQPQPSQVIKDLTWNPTQNTMDKLDKLKNHQKHTKKKHWDLQCLGRKPCSASGFGGNLWSAAMRGSSWIRQCCSGALATGCCSLNLGGEARRT